MNKFAAERQELPVYSGQWNETTKRTFEIMSHGAGAIALKESVGPAAAPRPGASPVPETVGSRAARGAFWTLAFSILGKCATLGCQIGLAWFLTPEHFGLASLALSVTALTSITCGGNLRNILIQRGERFEAEAGQVFWLSLALSTGAGVLLAVTAPWAALLFGEPRVAPLLCLLAIAAPFQSLPTIYSAALVRALRFRDTAAIHFVGAVAQGFLAVFFAWRGFGVYSLILPVLAVAWIMAAAYRLSAGGIRIGSPRPGRWGELLSPMSWLMVNSLLVVLHTYGVNLVIGSVEKSATIAGYYSWGYTVASQSVFLLATNLQGVLFPVLTRLQHDSARQYDAFRQSCQTLLAVVTPLCLAQIVFAPKIIPLIFHERWDGAIPVVQWLSFGLCLQPLSTLATALLLARGSYRTLAILNGAFACAIPAAALVGSLSGDQREIAASVGISLVLLNLVSAAVGASLLKRSVATLVPPISLPLLVGMGTASGAWWLDRWIHTGSPVLDVVVLGLSTGGVFAALVRLLLPRVAGGLLARLRHRALGTASGAPDNQTPVST